MIAELRITPPQSTSYQVIGAGSVTINGEANFSNTLTAVILTNWETYYNESDSTSALQQNAYVEYLEDGVYKFRGKIWSIVREVQDGYPTIQITCFDKLHVLTHTLAVYGGNYVWSRYTPSEALTRVQLYKLPYYAGGYRERWAPNFASHAWVDYTTVPQTFTLNQTASYTNTTTFDTSIRATQANLGFPPSGIIRIDTGGGVPSCIAYNGYTYKASDGYWWFNNCDWVEDSGAGLANLLGGTAITHNAGANVYLMQGKRIHFDTRILIEGKEGANYEPVIGTHYRPNDDDGTFIFSSSPLTLQLGAAAYDSMWGSYAVYDEDGVGGGTPLTLATVLSDMLLTSPALFGPGFGGGYTDTATVDISISPSITITRLVVDTPSMVGDVIRGLLSDLGLLKGVTTDAIAMWYDSEADSICIKTITQGSAARTYTGESRRNVEVSMESVGSAVGAMYQTGEGFNLVETNRVWHTQASGAAPPVASGTTPIAYKRVGTVWSTANTGAPNLYNMTQAGTATTPVQQTLNLITDNDSATGLGLFWDTAAHAKTGGGQQFYAWFPGSTNQLPDAYYISKVTAVFELIGSSESDTAGFCATIKTAPDVVPNGASAPTTAGGWKYLDQRLTCQFTSGSYAYQTVTIEADDLFVLSKGISIEITSPMTASVSGEPDNTGLFGFCLLDLRVEGVQLNFASCQLKGTYATSDAGTLTAAESYAKLVDLKMGQFYTKLIQLGPSTREVALNFCWLQLLQLLALAQAKEYDITSDGIDDGNGPPVLMDVVQLSDAAIGVCDSYTYTNIGGERSLNLRIIDYNSPLFGSAI